MDDHDGYVAPTYQRIKQLELPQTIHSFQTYSITQQLL